MTKKKPVILVTNDDGITAAGIRKLIQLVRPLGKVIVVGSEFSMSGMGHAITVKTPLRIRKVSSEPDYEEYITNGTPVDCVKLAEHVVLKGEYPDLLVSGINHGSNASVNIVYSGTMAAVLEGCIDGIPSVGFSLEDYSLDADFSHLDNFVRRIAVKILKNGLPEGICLNVNIPKNNGQPIKGIKVCRQAKARWVEDFNARTDPHGRDYYWLTGKFENDDRGDDTDEYALENQYISVVPVTHDMTAHYAITGINDLNLGLDED